jgi:hypothetical protein
VYPNLRPAKVDKGYEPKERERSFLVLGAGNKILSQLLGKLSGV